MRKLDIRILEILAAARGPIDHQTLGELSLVDSRSTGFAIGPSVGRVGGDNAKLEEEFGPNLISLGYVVAKDMRISDERPTRAYSITDAGREALEGTQRQ